MPDAARDMFLLFYSEKFGAEAFKKAEEMRSEGKKVRMVMDNDGKISESLMKYHDAVSADESRKIIVHELETFDICDVLALGRK